MSNVRLAAEQTQVTWAGALLMIMSTLRISYNIICTRDACHVNSLSWVW